jgi:hypothetical protein
VAPVLLVATTDPEAASRDEILSQAVQVSDRMAELRSPRRTWRWTPYLVGTALVWEQLHQDGAVAEELWARVERVTAAANDPVLHGDHAAYAQAALDLMRLAGPGTEVWQTGLAVTDPPLLFAETVLDHDASTGEPIAGWWVDEGYGSRYWQDDLFMVLPWLAMRGSTRNQLPAEEQARNLAYEWLEAYAFDHRKLGDDADLRVPALRERRRLGWHLGDPASGRLLYDPGSGLWWHDEDDPGSDAYWCRGNGWAAAALVRTQHFLDMPYSGDRYGQVIGRTEMRRMLSQMAETLLAQRNTYGIWNADISKPGAEPGSAESSGAALLIYMLARAVNEGWLDEGVYTPAVLKAYHALTCLVDSDGDLHRIQRPASAPDSLLLLASDDPDHDLSYGPGAFLMAASEVARLPASWLARMEEIEAVVVERSRFTVVGDELVIDADQLGDFAGLAAEARSLAAFSGQQLLSARLTTGLEEQIRIDNTGAGNIVIFAAPSSPSHPLRTYHVAAVANTPGAYGRWWHSDLVVLNPGSAERSVELVYRPRSAASHQSLPVTVAPGTSLVMNDLLSSLAIQGAGTLTANADGPLLITSRTWTDTEHGAMGQSLPAQERFQSLAGDDRAYLLLLGRSDERYTNLGCMNLSERPAQVRFAVYSNDGDLLGQVAATVPARGAWQRTDALASIAADIDQVYAVVSGGPGLALLPYASVIDIRSGDPSLVLPQAPTAGVASGSSVYIPAAAHSDGLNQTRWRTDMAILSVGSEPATLTIALLASRRDNSSPLSTRLTAVAPGAAVHLSDILGSLFDYQGSAALRIDVENGAVLVNSRTFNTTEAGTWGQMIAGVPESDALRAGDTALIGHLAIGRSRDQGERTNIGFVNAGLTTLVASLDLIGSDGSRLASHQVSLPATSHRQLNDLLRSVSTPPPDGAYAVVSTATTGARLIAYASVVDNISGDPIYIPARRTDPVMETGTARLGPEPAG